MMSLPLGNTDGIVIIVKLCTPQPHSRQLKPASQNRDNTQVSSPPGVASVQQHLSFLKSQIHGAPLSTLFGLQKSLAIVRTQLRWATIYVGYVVQQFLQFMRFQDAWFANL